MTLEGVFFLVNLAFFASIVLDILLWVGAFMTGVWDCLTVCPFLAGCLFLGLLTSIEWWSHDEFLIVFGLGMWLSLLKMVLKRLTSDEV